MTNEQIILQQQFRLMRDGIIGSTGKTVYVEGDNGEKEAYPEPEPIHTYAGWKRLGFQVRKGQKAIACFPVWKHTDVPLKTDDSTGECIEAGERMFLTKAFWFSRDQCDHIVEADCN